MRPLLPPQPREPYQPAPVEPAETFFECIARGGRWTGWPLTRKQAQREAREAREREAQEHREERFMQHVRDGVEQRRLEMEEERRQREQERRQVEAPPPVEAPAPVEEQQERREEGEARLPDDLGEPYELRIPPPEYVCPWATRRAALARKKTVHFEQHMDFDSDDDYDDSMVSSDDSSDVDMHDADLGVPAPAVPVPNFADEDENEVQGRLPGYRGVDLALPDTQRPWARLERSPSPELPSSDSDVEAADLCAWGISVRKFAFQSWDRVRVEARETLVAAYMPRLALRHTTGQTVVQLPLTESAELRIAFGILSAPGNLHNHLRPSKDGDIDAGERALISERWNKTLKFFDTWGGPLGVKRLYTSLRLMMRQVPESIDAPTAFVLACRANDAGGAYKCLLTYGQVMFSDAGNRNMAFAQELRAMPSDCAARTNPESWNALLPKPYKLAVQLAGERWDPVRDLRGYAQGFLTIALRLVYGFSGETFFRPAFATPNTDGCDHVPAVASDKRLTRRIREVTGRPLPTVRNEQGTYRVPAPPPNEFYMDAMARRPRCLPCARLKAPEGWGSAWGCWPFSSHSFAYPAKRN